MKKLEEKVDRILEALSIISVKDIESDRTSSIAIHPDEPGIFKIVGVLTHGSKVTFDKRNAALMIKELKKIK